MVADTVAIGSALRFNFFGFTEMRPPPGVAVEVGVAVLDDVEVAVMASRHASVRDVNAGAAKKVSWELKKEQIASEWMDAGHSVWFRSLFDQFKTAIDAREYVGREAMDGLRCIELIATAYASARDGCRELPLGESALSLGT